VGELNEGGVALVKKDPHADDDAVGAEEVEDVVGLGL
jgi:hypothetical protein